MTDEGHFSRETKGWEGGAIKKEIRATDAKEVGMGNPAEKTSCSPNQCNYDLLFPVRQVGAYPKFFPSPFSQLFPEALVRLPGVERKNAEHRTSNAKSKIKYRVVS
jgi:hypothetical protein